MSNDSDQTNKNLDYPPASETEPPIGQQQPVSPTVAEAAAGQIDAASGPGESNNPEDAAVNAIDTSLPPYSEVEGDVEPPD